MPLPPARAASHGQQALHGRRPWRRPESPNRPQPGRRCPRSPRCFPRRQARPKRPPDRLRQPVARAERAISPRLSEVASYRSHPAFELMKPDHVPDGINDGRNIVFAPRAGPTPPHRCLALRPAADQQSDTPPALRVHRPCREAAADHAARFRSTAAPGSMARLLSRHVSGRRWPRRAGPGRIAAHGPAASPAEALAGASRQLQPSQPLPRAVSASFGEKRTDTPVAPFRQKPGSAPELPAGGPSPYHQRTPGERAEGFS